MIYEYTAKQLRNEVEVWELRTIKGMKKYKNRLTYYRRCLTKFKRADEVKYKSDISLMEESIDCMEKVLAQLEMDELAIDIKTEVMDIHEKIEAGIAEKEELEGLAENETAMMRKFFSNQPQ